MTSQHSSDEEIDEALLNLKRLVRKVVQEERLRDGLTGLANDEALIAWISNALEEGGDFWVAFVEVDRFKSVNDSFGYDAADDLLRAIGEQVHNAARHYLPDRVTPFRAHGDEFFLAGPGKAEGVHDALELLRANIAGLRVAAQEKGIMSCTVSTGWATNEDCWEHHEAVTYRAVRDCLERAVSAAKVHRNRVVRLDKTMVRTESCSGRADCSGCHAKFELRLPVDHGCGDALYCPQCGARVDRPSGLMPVGNVGTGEAPSNP